VRNIPEEARFHVHLGRSLKLHFYIRILPSFGMCRRLAWWNLDDDSEERTFSILYPSALNTWRWYTRIYFCEMSQKVHRHTHCHGNVEFACYVARKNLLRVPVEGVTLSNSFITSVTFVHTYTVRLYNLGTLGVLLTPLRLTLEVENS
jgi:hypothetical protein